MLNKNYKDDGISFMPMEPSQIEARNNLIETIKKGVYELKDVDCLCGHPSGDSITLSLKDRYGVPHKVIMCRKCSLIYNSPRFTESSLSMFYEKDYRDIYGFALDTMEGYFNSQYKHGCGIYDTLSEFTNLGEKSILDIGCATGGILYRFYEAGSRSVGIDMDERCLEYGRKKGMDLRNTSIGDFISGNEEKFDIIIMSHVLEHCDDPVGELEKIRDLLSEDGILFVEVPNIDPGIPEFHFLHYLQSAHLWYFDSGTLANTVKTAGFVIKELHDVKGEDLWVLLSPDSEGMSEKSVSWKNTQAVLRKALALKLRAWRENMVSSIRKIGG